VKNSKGLLKAGGCLTKVNISTQLKLRNKLYGCLMQVIAKFLTVFNFNVSACPYLNESDVFNVTYLNSDAMPVVGTTANYTCREGYATSKSTTRYCNSTLNWDGREPTCVKIECNSSMDISNGFYTSDLSSYEFGSVLQFHCDAGYNLIGDAALVCLSTGRWNATLPTCMPVNCGNISTPSNALVNYPNGTTFQSQAHTKCKPGFNISGSSVLTCNETGVWVPDLPNCIAISKHISFLQCRS